MARGQITNTTFSRRVKDFSRLCYRKCTPTDIDSFMEFDGKTFVIAELKYKLGDVSYGQRLALERLVDAIGHNPEVCSVGLILRYEEFRVNDGVQTIDVDLAFVEEIRWAGEWVKVGGDFVAKDVYDRITRKFSPNKLDHDVCENIHLDLYLDSLFNKK